MTRHRVPARPHQRQKGGVHGDKPPLQPAWRANADQLSHEEAEIEATGVDQQPLQDVGVAAEVHAAHAAGVVDMSEGAFEELATPPQQAQATGPADPSTYPLDRVARGPFDPSTTARRGSASLM